MTVVVYMGMTAAPSIRAGLLAAGRSPQTPVGVFARVTRPDAQAVVGTLDELAGIWSNRSTAAPPFSSSATWSRTPRHGAIRTQSQSSQNCWKPPNDLSARTEKNQDCRPVGGDRQPHLGRCRDLSHRRSMAGRRSCRMPRSSAPPTKPARCWPNRSPTMSARSAPISRRSKSRTPAAIKPGNLREHIRSEGVTIDLPVPA